MDIEINWFHGQPLSWAEIVIALTAILALVVSVSGWWDSLRRDRAQRRPRFLLSEAPRGTPDEAAILRLWNVGLGSATGVRVRFGFDKDGTEQGAVTIPFILGAGSHAGPGKMHMNRFDIALDGMRGRKAKLDAVNVDAIRRDPQKNWAHVAWTDVFGKPDEDVIVAFRERTRDATGKVWWDPNDDEGASYEHPTDDDVERIKRELTAPPRPRSRLRAAARAFRHG